MQQNPSMPNVEKKKLMDDYEIVVWRFHDYIHSGIPYKDGYIDGIFYGLAQVTGWEDAVINNSDISGALYLECEETTPRQVGRLIMEKWHLNGLKCIGNMDAKVTKIMVCGHVMEGGDSDSLIRRIDREDINLLLPLELIDFTLTEYIKDSGQLGMNRAILAAGHFNLEEPGMKYILHWIDDALKEHIETHYVQAGDMYTYM